MVRIFDSGLSGPTLTAPLSTQCINGYWQNAGGNPAMD